MEKSTTLFLTATSHVHLATQNHPPRHLGKCHIHLLRLRNRQLFFLLTLPANEAFSLGIYGHKRSIYGGYHFASLSS